MNTVPLPSEPLDEAQLLHFPSLRAIDGFAHAVTTRPWNMATHCGPDTNLAARRRRRVCQNLGLPFENLTAPDQIHSAHVLPIRSEDVGRGREGRHDALRFVDGLVCALPAVPLIQFSADCPLILAVAPRQRIFATAHASWRGTVARIALELVRQLRRTGVEPADLVAGIGPCAGPQTYEVGDEVRRIAEAQWEGAAECFDERGGAIFFDLRRANAMQLIDAGIRPENITIAAECTTSDPRLYSFRREGEGAGRFAIIAGFVPSHQ